MNSLLAKTIRAHIGESAKQAGFDLCGIAPVELEQSHVLAWREWIDGGRHGEMRYMERPERADLRKLTPWVKSVIALGLNYWLPPTEKAITEGVHRAVPSDVVSIYAQGKDYHDVMQQKMEQMLGLLREALPVGFEAKMYVDTGPILERAYAEAGGLGWIGKNTCLINQERGSWFFLGEILTNLELPPDAPPPDRCGSCTRCLDACPTGAFIAPYQLDSRKCISYQTIELRGAIREEDRAAIGSHVFGCDICQEVCPWNSRAQRTLQPTTTDFLPLKVFSKADTRDLATLSADEFMTHFAESPVKRTKYLGFLRNIAVALGNSGEKSALTVLRAMEANHQTGDPVVQEHVKWAINQLDSASANEV